jgi:hypothetical protein
MTTAPPAAAARLKRPSWRDPRLLIGILLVLASVAGVTALLGAADRSTEMYTARENIVVGQRLDRAALTVVRVRLGDSEGSYWPATEPLPTGKVAVRLIPKGELVPRSSLATADALDRKPAALAISEPLPKEAEVGSRVDVWVASPNGTNGYNPPRLLLPGAEIAELTPSSTALGGTRETLVHVLVTDAQMPELLGALANEAKVAVVWNPAGGRE